MTSTPSLPQTAAAAPVTATADPLGELLEGTAARLHNAVPVGVTIGEVVALRTEAPRALVAFPGMAGAAPAAAQSVVDLHGAHIGKPVVLMFENGDISRPIVMGVLQGDPGWPAARTPHQVEVDADGQRMVIGARQQLVLRCGAASITLHQDGRIWIAGTQIVSQADGVNRIRGGSVQLN
jgi:hypothetical protein